MVPRQHIGSGSSRRYRCKRRRADVRNMLEMVGCSRLPGSHGTVARQKRGIARTIRSRSKRCISFNTCIRSRASSRGYTFEACVFGAVRVVEGSSCSRGDGSGTYHSGSSCSSPVDVRGPRGLRGSTVVVHGRRGSSRTRVFERR